ncbi:glutathione peroxidase [Thermoflavimicrobium daqui]|uniref:Glutathione peroxidase n=1 Tax=Thermoflavimicrobium daqui TaxID=2137476 RepID=A0A364K191_9BACL|nr:glutathione peroxidase [Thermoflavimicrobium daqui]RAL21451.1 glutathione peroxidase [Thermoflavimicrobium daqui]
MTIHSYHAKLITGEEKALADFVGQVVLIVNTASKCGFTPQYKELQTLYEKYHQQGFVILAFPCDQFRNQEFTEHDQIAEFCQVNYRVSFPLFQKVDVKGKHAHPLFQYLTENTSGFLTKTIKWNFTKFLVNQKGHVIKRYGPPTKPSEIEKDIVALLKD